MGRLSTPQQTMQLSGGLANWHRADAALMTVRDHVNHMASKSDEGADRIRERGRQWGSVTTSPSITPRPMAPSPALFLAAGATYAAYPSTASLIR